MTETTLSIRMGSQSFWDVGSELHITGHQVQNGRRLEHWRGSKGTMEDSCRSRVDRPTRQRTSIRSRTGSISWLFALCSSTITSAFVCPSSRTTSISTNPCDRCHPVKLTVYTSTVQTQHYHSYSYSPTQRSSNHILFAKRNRKTNGFGDDMNSWYDRVNENATPDKVFWEEMERQRLFNQLGGENRIPTPSSSSMESGSTTSSSFTGSSSSSSSATPLSSTGDSSRKPPTMDQLRIADATLSEYTRFQVQNNWLNENLQSYFNQMATLDLEEDLSLDEETRRLEEQLEHLPDGYGANGGSDDTNGAWRENNDSSEPWEYWGDDDKGKAVDLERANALKVPEPSKGKEKQIDTKCRYWHVLLYIILF